MCHTWTCSEWVLVDLKRKSAARDRSSLVVRSVRDTTTPLTSLTDDVAPQNGLPLRVLFFVDLKFSSWMKQLLLWTQIQRKLYRKHLTRLQRVERQSPSLTAYPLSKMLIACKCHCRVLRIENDSNSRPVTSSKVVASMRLVRMTSSLP